MRPFLAILRRDLAVALAQGSATLLSVAFFVVTITLFPLGVGPETATLARISSGVLWVAALLSVLLSLDRLFQADHEDGSLEQISLGPLPLELVVLAKVAAHWLSTGLPLILAAPILALLLNMPVSGLPVLLLAMALGTPVLSLIGAIGAALTLGLRRGGVLLSLIVLPLYIPVLIFGVAAVDAAISGLGARPHLLILAAMLAPSLVLAPVAAAASIRLAME